MLDPIEFGKAMAEIVREHTAPLLKRIEELESRQPQRGEKGDRGDKGDAGVGEKGEKGDAGDKGIQGEKGDRGNDAEPIDIKEVVTELLVAPEIKTLVDLHVAEAVQKHFETNPVRHGKDGDPGKQGERGDKGEQGTDGIDGVGLAGAMIDREGSLIVTTTKGAAINLGCVVGKNGERGKDGADFSNATLDYDGARGLIIRGAGGEIVKRLPIPMDAGYWRDGMACEKGDIVTHAGTAWIAIADTKAKPSHEAKEWRLFARGGRDGVDGKKGRDLGPAPPVKLGSGNA